MSDEKKRIYCPIINSEIDARACFDAALVYEEMSPRSEMPDGMEFTKENQEICIKCRHHPD